MENKNIKEYRTDEVPELRFFGRGTGDPYREDGSAVLFWGASGFGVTFRGGELWVRTECDFSVYEVWVCVKVDGRQVSRFMVRKGTDWVCAARGFDGKTPHYVEFLRETQPMPSDPAQFLAVSGIAVNRDAEFLPSVEPGLRIEFVGDSITSGEGLAGAVGEWDWISTWISANSTYAARIAASLGAEHRIFSQCGWGVSAGWDNNPHTVIPPYYGQVCGVMPGEFQERLGAHRDYDFSSWKADAVVVNLGTNDSSAMSSPAWTDPEDGVRCSLDGERLSVGVADFLRVVRKFNPDALILWVWGMIDIPTAEEFIRRGIGSYISESGDGNVFAMRLDPMSECEKSDGDRGSRGHPGPETHRRAAEKITAFLRDHI